MCRCGKHGCGDLDYFSSVLVCFASLQNLMHSTQDFYVPHSVAQCNEHMILRVMLWGNASLLVSNVKKS